MSTLTDSIASFQFRNLKLEGRKVKKKIQSANQWIDAEAAWRECSFLVSAPIRTSQLPESPASRSRSQQFYDLVQSNSIVLTNWIKWKLLNFIEICVWSLGSSDIEMRPQGQSWPKLVNWWRSLFFFFLNKKPTRNLDTFTETTGECWDPPWWITNEIRCRRSSSIGRWSHSDDLARAVSSSEYVDRSDVPPVSSSTWIAALLKFSDFELNFHLNALRYVGQ